ncbi:MAG: hypothetical protein MRK01_14925 [Candidatus Scalindua sp.]|nr:hypothetical protein [Candidatus Scalindua sp.]
MENKKAPIIPSYLKQLSIHSQNINNSMDKKHVLRKGAYYIKRKVKELSLDT